MQDNSQGTEHLMSSTALIEVVETGQEKQSFGFLLRAVRLKNFGKSATQT